MVSVLIDTLIVVDTKNFFGMEFYLDLKEWSNFTQMFIVCRFQCVIFLKKSSVLPLFTGCWTKDELWPNFLDLSSSVCFHIFLFCYFNVKSLIFLFLVISFYDTKGWVFVFTYMSISIFTISNYSDDIYSVYKVFSYS